MIAKDLEARVMKSEKNVETLLAEGRYDVLNELFEDYYKTQLSVEFIGREDYKGIRPFYHPTLIAVEDSVFQIAMLTLIYTERVSKAYRLYEVRKNWIISLRKWNRQWKISADFVKLPAIMNFVR